MNSYYNEDEELNMIHIDNYKQDSDSQNQNQFKNENENQSDRVLHKEPKKIRCQYCGITGYTVVDKYNTLMSYLLVLLTLLLFGLSGIGVFPMLIVYCYTKTYRHKCSICRKTLGYDNNMISILPFQNQIITLKFGELGIITKKSTIINVLFILLILFSIHYKFGKIYKDLLLTVPDEEKLVPNNDTWDQFRKKCSYQKIDRNDTEKIKCQNYALDRYFQNWEGYIVRVKDESQSSYNSYYHGIVIELIMDQQQDQNQIDLRLTLDDKIKQQYYDIIEQLETGQKIKFSGIFKGLGNSQSPRHFHCKYIEIQDQIIQIDQKKFQETNNDKH